MKTEDFYKIYIPALEKAFQNDSINWGFYVKSPEDYLDDEVSAQKEKVKAQKALKNGIVGPKGEIGILALTKSEIAIYAKQGITGYPHKIKMLNAGGNTRILGKQVNIGSKKHFLFDKAPKSVVGH